MAEGRGQKEGIRMKDFDNIKSLVLLLG